MSVFLYQDDEKEERILLPEEQAISTLYMDGQSDVTIQCLDEPDVPPALKSPVVTGRALDQWQSRCVGSCLFNFFFIYVASILGRFGDF